MVGMIVSGACGRMGTKILGEARKVSDIAIAGALVRSGDRRCAVQPDDGVPCSDDITLMPADSVVLVEFSTPDATIGHLGWAREHKVPVLIGTTGFSESQERLIHEAAQEIPVLESHNYGIGMNAFWEILKVATAYLGTDYDIEIIEFHAAAKPDVPSGTGLTIASVIAGARGDALDEVVRFGRDRDRTFSRKKGEIGMHSLRAGSYRSDHTVVFAGNGERLEFTHREEDSSIIARGVLWGVRFLQDRPSGLYGMADVLRFMRDSR